MSIAKILVHTNTSLTARLLTGIFCLGWCLQLIGPDIRGLRA